MLARLALSRGAKAALSVLIVVLAVLLVFSQISGSGSNPGSQAPATKSGFTAPSPKHDAGIGPALEETPAETLRQRALR